MRATCALFGSAICNATGNYSATLQAVTARWNYNHTPQWIDGWGRVAHALANGLHAPPSRRFSSSGPRTAARRIEGASLAGAPRMMATCGGACLAETCPSRKKNGRNYDVTVENTAGLPRY